MAMQLTTSSRGVTLRKAQTPASLRTVSRPSVCVRAEPNRAQIIKPVNGDPFVGFFETPVTSAPIVASYLSNLPAYRMGVSPTLRGVEIGLAHGFLLAGPFIKLGPLRNVAGTAEIVGCASAAGVVLILALCLSIYGSATFQGPTTPVGLKTLSGRAISRDPLQTSEGWSGFAAGWTIGGLSGAGFAYILTQVLPYYQ